METCSIWKTKVLLNIALLVVAGLSHIRAEQASGQSPKKTAVFVTNHSGPAYNDKVAVLEEFLPSRVAEKGISVISQNLSINALKNYSNPSGPSSEPVSKLDQVLSDSTSALRLAQNLGADYLLEVSIAAVTSDQKVYVERGLKTQNTIHTLKLTYRLLECNQGGSVTGSAVQVSKTIRATGNSAKDSSAVITELLDEAALKVAEKVGETQSSIKSTAAQPPLVEISVFCTAQGGDGLAVSMPDIRLRDDGSLFVSTNYVGLQVVGASVEMDGITLGSLPGKFKVRPGLGKLRVTREGFKDWERTVNCADGQKFEAALQMSDAAYARWKDSTAFLLAIQSGKQLTEGIRDMMAGLAQTFRQSGYRLDAEVKAAGKSLFDGATLEIYERTRSAKNQ
jgi:hypothetical protein